MAAGVTGGDYLKGRSSRSVVRVAKDIVKNVVYVYVYTTFVISLCFQLCHKRLVHPLQQLNREETRGRMLNQDDGHRMPS